MATELDITAGLVDLTSTLVDRINAMDKRLARIERELAIQDRVLTELRRERALKYDATKPLPGTEYRTTATPEEITQARKITAFKERCDDDLQGPFVG